MVFVRTFALQEEGEEEEADGVRMLCFVGEIVGESGSTMVGMHREGSVQQWDELQRHKDEKEDVP